MWVGGRPISYEVPRATISAGRRWVLFAALRPPFAKKGFALPPFAPKVARGLSKAVASWRGPHPRS
jgi:hypothetical protein